MLLGSVAIETCLVLISGFQFSSLTSTGGDPLRPSLLLALHEDAADGGLGRQFPVGAVEGSDSSQGADHGQSFCGPLQPLERGEVGDGAFWWLSILGFYSSIHHRDLR